MDGDVPPLSLLRLSGVRGVVSGDGSRTVLSSYQPTSPRGYVSTPTRSPRTPPITLTVVATPGSVTVSVVWVG